MPSASHDELPEQEIVPGYSSRFADWGGITVAFEQATAGQDVSSLLDDLPGGRCQAPHWGFLFKGRLSVDYGDRTVMLHGGEIVLDVSGDSRKHLQVEDLIEMFRKIRGQKLDDDELLIG